MSDGASEAETELAAASRAEAETWALVLAAEGVASRSASRAGRWFVAFARDDETRARAALEAYSRENALAATPAAEPDPDVPTRAGFWLAFGLIAAFAWTGAWSENNASFAAGAMDARRVLRGELWRTLTALTLHADAAHVLGNAFSCAVFGTLLLRRFGAGVGAALLLCAGALGNLLAAAWQGSGYRSVGASTALFGAIGALAATELVRRRRSNAAWGRAWLPLAGGLGLVAMLGTGPRSDLSAHLFGLAVGSALGWIAARAVPRPPLLSTQLAAGGAALLALASAWIAAFAAAGR